MRLGGVAEQGYTMLYGKSQFRKVIGYAAFTLLYDKVDRCVEHS
jgi:hypothetical protein